MKIIIKEWILPIVLFGLVFGLLLDCERKNIEIKQLKRKTQRTIKN